MKAHLPLSSSISETSPTSRWWLRTSFLLLFFVNLTFSASAQIKIWDKTLGTEHVTYQDPNGNFYQFGEEDLTVLITTPDGGYLLGGSSDSGINRDKTQASKGGVDYWIIKIDADGNKVWDRTFGSIGYDGLRAIVVSPDGGYLLGGSSSAGIGGDKSQARKSYWIVKINANGDKIWDKSYGGSTNNENNETFSTLIATPDGGYLLGGTSISGKDGDKSQESRGHHDYWIIKTDANGDKVWDKSFGGDGYDELTSLAAAPDGGYLLGGSSTSGISGDKSNASKGNKSDYWIIKIDDSGNKLWDKTYGGSSNDNLAALVVTSDGYLLGGNSGSEIGEDKTAEKKGNSDYWIVKINKTGDKIWDKTYGGIELKNGPEEEKLQDLIATTDGGFLLGGYSNAGIGGDKTEGDDKTDHYLHRYNHQDYWVVKIDATGDKIWDKTLGGDYIDIFKAMTIAPDGGYVLGGNSSSQTSGDKTEDALGSVSDYWIVKINETGKKGQHINTFHIPSQMFNGKPVNLSASTTSGLPASYTVISGPATVNGNILTITGIGTVTVSAFQAGNDTYLPAPAVEQSFIVDKATPVTKLWDKTFGGSSSDNLLALVATSDGYLLGGKSDSEIGADKSENRKGSNDYWIVRINANGDKVWDKTIGGLEPDYLNTIIATTDGFFLLGGSSAESETGGDKNDDSKGLYDIWVVKIDADGNKVWDKTYGGSNYDALNDIVATPDGNYLLAGYSRSGISGDKTQDATGNWLIKIDNDGNIIWDRSPGGAGSLNEIVVTSDGNFMLGGSISFCNYEIEECDYEIVDFWVMKITSTGQKIWEKSYGGNKNESLDDLVSTPDGGYLLGGSSGSGISGDKTQANKGSEDYWVIKIDANGDKIWDKSFGGSGRDSFSSLAAVPDGGYILGGNSNSGISGDKSNALRGDKSDYWIVRIDDNGNKLWDKAYGSAENDKNDIKSESLSALIVTPDSGFLLGGSSDLDIGGDKSENSKGDSDFWVIKIKEETVAPPPVSSSWNLRYGGSREDRFTVVIQTQDGGYLSGGYSKSEISGDKSQSSRGGADFWIVKTDKNGSKQWDKRYGGSSHDYLNRIIQTKDGGYLLAGSSTSGKGGDKSEGRRGDQDYWIVKISSTGVKEWDKTYGGSGFDDLRKVTRLSNGDYLLAGQSNSPLSGDKSQASQGGLDYWIVRVTSTGKKLWDKRYGGTNDEYLESFTKTPDGGFLLAGSSASGQGGDKSQTSKGGKDYWLVKINSKGNKLWDKSFGGSQDDELYSIGITPEKDFFVAGNSSSGQSGDKSQPSQGSSDYWMLKLNSNGEKLWDRTFGGLGTETLRSIIYVQGGYVLAGSSNSNISGDKSQNSQGGTDYWLVKTDTNGNKEYDQQFGGSGNDEFRYIQQTSDGGLLLGGRSDSEASGDRTQPSQGSTDYWLVKVGPDTPANMPLVSARLNIPQEQSGVEMLKLTAYPNPAAGDVTMAFTVSQTQPVTLKIYNNQSQEVATLFQAVAQEGQEYKATWSPKQIAPGMYLLRLQTKDKVHTQKLIVSK